jgi:cysteine-rich repeat protein
MMQDKERNLAGVGEAACLAALLVTACGVGLTVPVGSAVFCERDANCPGDMVCHPGKKQCAKAAEIGVGCGNSILDAGELCDDGNTAGGDGCSSDCRSDGA